MDNAQQTENGIASVTGMELLLFNLGEKRFAIDITRVKEVIPRPDMTQVPHSHPAVCGVMHLREEAVAVIDLQQAIGEMNVDISGQSVIVTELLGGHQGFLVSHVDRIIYCAEDELGQPPSGIGDTNYTAQVARHNEELIQLLDFHKILGHVLPGAVAA